MKTIKIIIVVITTFILQYASAQTPTEIRRHISNGDCEKAQSLYNVYKAMNGSDKTMERMIAECIDEKTSVSGSLNGHEYVDLGLPSGTLWATCNIGASKPEDYGNYFAWGETTTKSIYDWDTYRYATGRRNSQLTKYCNKSIYGYNGFTDNLTTLLPEDDPATANWGTGWHTPSKVQWEELKDNTTRQWTSRGGKNGMLFTSKKNGQTLFLPAADSSWDSKPGSNGNYWSRSLTDCPSDAWYLFFYSDDCYMSSLWRRQEGLSVRPVYEK